MPSGRNWRSQQLGFSQNALQGKLCSSSSSSSKQCRCFFLSDWRGHFCFASPVCIHQMGARSSVENLGEGGIAGKEIPGSLPASSNSSFFAMKLEDNADSALYPRRRKKSCKRSHSDCKDVESEWVPALGLNFPNLVLLSGASCVTLHLLAIDFSRVCLSSMPCSWPVVLCHVAARKGPSECFSFQIHKAVFLCMLSFFT